MSVRAGGQTGVWQNMKTLRRAGSSLVDAHNTCSTYIHIHYPSIHPSTAHQGRVSVKGVGTVLGATLDWNLQPIQRARQCVQYQDSSLHRPHRCTRGEGSIFRKGG